MDDIINSFSKLNISEKKIIGKIIKENDDIDNLIESFEKINIKDTTVSENFDKLISKFVNFFKSLKEKEECHPKISRIIPNWTY